MGPYGERAYETMKKVFKTSLLIHLDEPKSTFIHELELSRQDVEDNSKCKHADLYTTHLDVLNL